MASLMILTEPLINPTVRFNTIRNAFEKTDNRAAFAFFPIIKNY